MGEPDTVARVVDRLRSRGPTTSVRGDADQLLRQVEPVVRRAVVGLVPPDRQEDVVQQTLEIAWRRLPDFEPHGPSFASWVRGIARKVAANDRRRRVELLSADGMMEEGDPSASVLELLQRDERDQLVTDAISTCLEGVEQDVLYHRYVHGLERDAIAELLGLADADAVRVTLQRAQRRLKAELRRRLAELGHGRSYLGPVRD